MNKPITAKPVPDGTRVSSTDKAVASRVLTNPAPRRKPTGPMIYRVDNGADVWPGRK
jgi:hypothetical protein